MWKPFVVFLVIGIVDCGFIFYVLARMLREFNATQPATAKLQMFGFDQNAILKHYKEKFPDGPLGKVYWALLIVLGLSWLAAGAACEFVGVVRGGAMPA